MTRMRRITALLGGALVVTAAIAGCAKSPRLTVEGGPVADGTTAAVQGTGFAPGEEVTILQCATAPIGIVDCDLATSTNVSVAADGSFDAVVPVHALLQGWGRSGTDCRTPGSCVLAAAVDPTVAVEGSGDFHVALPVSATYDTEWGSADCRSPEEQRHLLATRGRSLGDGPSTVARLDLHFAPDAPLEPAPSPALTASPTAGLGDFQSVTVQGTAFEPTSAVAVKVCRSGDTSNCDVRNGETVAAGLDGSIATEITVWPSWTRFGWGDATDCRVAPGCVIAATPHGSPTAAATLPLSFGPSSPTRGRYLDPVFDQVQVDGDVVYRQTVDNEGRPIQLKMDFFRPAGDTATNRPVMMWMHGGFFTAGDKSTMHDDAIASAKRGYVGVAIQYRLHRGGTEGWRDSFRGSLDAYDDATAAVQWLQAHAAQYGVNPDAIVAGDFSAGAITALNLGYLPGQRGPASSLVAAVVSRGGILYTPPAAGDPPTIAFHGSVDDVTDFATMRDACDLASAVDVACELVVYDGQRHTSGDLDDVHRRTSDFVAEHVLRPLGYLDP